MDEAHEITFDIFGIFLNFCVFLIFLVPICPEQRSHVDFTAQNSGKNVKILILESAIWQGGLIKVQIGL